MIINTTIHLRGCVAPQTAPVPFAHSSASLSQRDIPRIAQRFSVGPRRRNPQVPKGRLRLFLRSDSSVVPSGLGSRAAGFPTRKRWANIGCPFGTGLGVSASTWAPLLALLALLALTPAPARGQQYNWTTLAGNIGGAAYRDDTGSAARFYAPFGVALDGAGNLYLADRLNQAIRRVTPAGAVSTLAGAPGTIGSTDGAGSAARLYYPSGLALDASGNIYVAQDLNHTIRKITSAGVVTTLAGFPGVAGGADGTGSGARFNGPSGLAVDGSGNIFVADQYNHTIRKVTAGGVVTTLAGLAGSSGSTDGTGSAARFNVPSGVTIDSSGNLFVADEYNDTIRKVTSAGVVTTLAGLAGSTGRADGTGSAARFYLPYAVAVDGAGNVCVADLANDRIRKVTPAGVVTTLAGGLGSGSADGTNATAYFDNPRGVAVDASGIVYVGDSQNNTLRKVTPAGVVTTLAGLANVRGSANGTGTAARFDRPSGVGADASNNVFVADSNNSSIRKVTPAAVVSTLAGPTAGFWVPGGVGLDASNNVFVADSGAHTLLKVTPAGVVTTLAGSPGQTGTADGTGGDARFNNPTGVAADGSGNLYVADKNNHEIRKVTSAGVVTTLAGYPFPGAADGSGSSAHFNHPSSVAVDVSGNVFVADTDNHTIRKITAGGLVSTLAGTAGSLGSADGIGSSARFYLPTGVAVDASGNVYVADLGYGLIRKVTPAGVVTTLGGATGSNVSLVSDGIGAVARFHSPQAVAVDPSGNIFVADTLNNRIVQGTPIPLITALNPAATTTGSPDLTLQLNGSGFVEGATVLWNGATRATTFISAGQLQAAIPSADLVLSGQDIATVPVTVQNPNLAASTPQAFAIVSANVGTVQSQVAGAGQTATANAPPPSTTEAGLTASLNNSSGSQPVAVTAATYGSNPGSGTTFNAGSSYLDIKVSGATANNTMTSYFYYPATVTGSAETALALLYYTGSAWVTVRSSGGLAPVKATTDNLDGTTSGGRFTVLFDSTSTPSITQLTGTPFALALDTTPPVITCPTNIVTVTDPGLSTARVTFAPTATDNSGAATVVCNPPSGAAFPFGVTTVNCTATDPSGNPASCSFTVTVNQAIPEIAVEQPAGTGLTDGAATIDFGTSSAGLRGPAKTFRIRNVGDGYLTGLAINRDGADASSFVVIANPVPPVGPNGSTTFTVQFNPASAGTKTAAIHIANNDSDENPFDIVLTGQAVISSSPVLQVNNGSLGFSNTLFGFDVLAESGKTIVIQASTNLLNWFPLLTNVSGADPFRFSDPQSAAKPVRFYRAVVQP